MKLLYSRKHFFVWNGTFHSSQTFCTQKSFDTRIECNKNTNFYPHCQFPTHPVFLITANTKKILTRIWQLFLNLLDARNPKIWLKLKFNEPFLSYQLRSTANPALWAALFWAVLLCPQKGLVRFQFKSYFWISCIK